jgi:hypothetical protein
MLAAAWAQIFAIQSGQLCVIIKVVYRWMRHLSGKMNESNVIIPPTANR